MIVKMKEPRDKNKACAAALTDLTKAYDFLKHDLLNAKLLVFGFDYKSLRVMHAYLNNRFQVTKAVSYYSDGVFGVPQSSLLCPLLFNTNIGDLDRLLQIRFFKLFRWHHPI